MKFMDYADEVGYTDHQRIVAQALDETGNNQLAACRKLGMHRSSFRSALRLIKAKLASRGISDSAGWNYTVPDGFKMKGVSDMRTNAEGKPVWYKTDIDKERQFQLMQSAIEALTKGIEPYKPIEQTFNTSDKLCNQYTFTDYHMGMLAWHREGGADWDINIAQKMLIAAFSHMVAAAPPADECVISQLGDFLHTDGLVPATPASGHVLDADSRYRKIVDATVVTLKQLIDMALQKHKRVHVIMAEGNHDESGSCWLSSSFRLLYANEPRVEINDSRLPYYVHKFGNNMLAFHHGHKKKLKDLPGLFAAQFHEIWGSTTKRYAHCGHYHHREEVSVSEDNGMQVIRHPTLAARDAYAARGGWHSERGAICHTYHIHNGLTGTSIVTPEMLGH